jgi:hypothetical protein
MPPSPRPLPTLMTMTAPFPKPSTGKAPSNASDLSSPTLSHLRPAVTHETVGMFPKFWFSKLRYLTSTLVEVARKRAGYWFIYFLSHWSWISINIWFILIALFVFVSL